MKTKEFTDSYDAYKKHISNVLNTHEVDLIMHGYCIGHTSSSRQNGIELCKKTVIKKIKESSKTVDKVFGVGQICFRCNVVIKKSRHKEQVLDKVLCASCKS